MANAAARIAAGLVGATGAATSAQMQEACVDIDLSTFDPSCQADSDCTSVYAGMACPSGCTCENAAINVADRQRYDETIGSLPFTPRNCPCPSGHPAVCAKGVCTY